MTDLIPIRHDQTSLAGRIAVLLSDIPTNDAGASSNLPMRTERVVIVDDTPNPNLTVRVHPIGDPATLVRIDVVNLGLVETGDTGPTSTTSPEVGSKSVAAEDQRLQAEAGDLIEPIVQGLAALGPADWETFTATFALAGPAEIARLEFSRGNDATPTPVPLTAMEPVRRHRAIAARMSAGPWWRMRIDVDDTGQVREHFDYGDEPFPADQLFRPEDYRADFEKYPRRRAPVWLAGYVAGPAAQGRSPDQAVEAAHRDAGAGVVEVLTHDIVVLDEAWSRWAVLAAIKAGMRRAVGPWIEPAAAVFENGKGSGATLCILPRDRAVLSGGVWNSPLLDVAYNGGGALPELYAGAPAWVNDSVLDGRGQRGALSFCYWWHDGEWYRGATKTFDELDDPLPVIWTDEETVDAIVEEVGENLFEAVVRLVTAAAARSVTSSDLAAVLREHDADLGAAANQLSLAGLLP